MGDDAGQRGARVGQHLLNHVAKTVVIDALLHPPAAVGRQESPRGNAAARHGLTMDGSSEGCSQEKQDGMS